MLHLQNCIELYCFYHNVCDFFFKKELLNHKKNSASFPSMKKKKTKLEFLCSAKPSQKHSRPIILRKPVIQ